MPERENVPGRVNIAVVSDTTLTGPFSYSQTRSTFRTVAGDDSATRASLGGVGFVDFHENAASVLAFIGQLRSQCGPAGVEYRLGQVRFCQPGAGDVAGNDQGVFVHHVPTKFVQRIAPAIADFSVDGPNTLLIPRLLSNGQIFLQIPVEATRFQRLARAWGGGGFEAQVDTGAAGSA